MKDSWKAKNAGRTICVALKAKNAENKINTYRQKLSSALSFKDYDRFCNILLQLSSYAEVSLDFAYDLFDDFEANKNLAFSFVNSLDSKKNREGEENNEK